MMPIDRIIERYLILAPIFFFLSFFSLEITRCKAMGNDGAVMR
jgi:hypothetical protein